MPRATSSFPSVQGLIEEYELDADQRLLIGEGGGAGALIPYIAERLGLKCEISRDAEVISSIGAALALVRDVVERVIPNPQPEDLLAIRREALEAGGAGGRRRQERRSDGRGRSADPPRARHRRRSGGDARQGPRRLDHRGRGARRCSPLDGGRAGDAAPCRRDLGTARLSHRGRGPRRRARRRPRRGNPRAAQPGAGVPVDPPNASPTSPRSGGRRRKTRTAARRCRACSSSTSTTLPTSRRSRRSASHGPGGERAGGTGCRPAHCADRRSCIDDKVGWRVSRVADPSHTRIARLAVVRWLTHCRMETGHTTPSAGVPRFAIADVPIGC